jgi:hypothetical protein
MDPRQEITVVSGLPRSGTSMMMRMINAGGIPALTDHLREADPDNPHGYFELESVKRTRQDPSWLDGARGTVVKMVHLLVRDLPADRRYAVVLMHRDLDEVLDSQRTMLERSGRPGAQMPREALKRVFAQQMEGVASWLASQPNIRRLNVDYARVVAQPRAESARIADFLGLGAEAGERMAAAVDPSLYRNRH